MGGFISNLIGQKLQTDQAEALQEALEAQKNANYHNFVLTNATDPALAHQAHQNLKGMFDEWAPKELEEHGPQFEQQLQMLAAMHHLGRTFQQSPMLQTLAGQQAPPTSPSQTDQIEPPPTAPAGTGRIDPATGTGSLGRRDDPRTAQQKTDARDLLNFNQTLAALTPQKEHMSVYDRIAGALMGFGGGVTGRIPPPLTAQFERQQKQRNMQQNLQRIGQAVQTGAMTMEQGKDALRYMITAAHPGETAAEKLDLYRQQTLIDQQMGKQKVADQIAAIDQLPISDDEKALAKADVIAGHSLNLAPKLRSGGKVQGTDPGLQQFGRDNGVVIDPNKAYLTTMDAYGNYTSAREAASVSDQLVTQLKGRIQANMMRGMSEADARREAGDFYIRYGNLGLDQRATTALVNATLAGIDMSKTPAATPAPAPTAAGPTTQPAITPAPTPSAPTAATPSGVSQAPLTTGPSLAPLVRPKKGGGKELNPAGHTVVTNWTRSLMAGGGGVGRGGQAAILGMGRAIEAVAQVTGKSTPEIEFDASTYHGALKGAVDATTWFSNLLRVSNQVDQFGDLFSTTAQVLKQTDPAILNRPWQQITTEMTTGNPALAKYLLSLNALNRVYTIVSAGAPASRGMPPVDTSKHVEELLAPSMPLKDAAAKLEQIKAEKDGDIRAYYGQMNDLRTLFLSNSIAQALGTRLPAAPPAPAKRATPSGNTPPSLTPEDKKWLDDWRRKHGG